jgi:hypothetical protein
MKGFAAIADTLAIQFPEKDMRNGYRALLNNLEDETVFKRNEKAVSRSRNCGYLHEETAAPGTVSSVQAREGLLRAFNAVY